MRAFALTLAALLVVGTLGCNDTAETGSTAPATTPTTNATADAATTGDLQEVSLTLPGMT